MLPFDAVGGLQAIHLSGYEAYRVPDLFDCLEGACPSEGDQCVETPA